MESRYASQGLLLPTMPERDVQRELRQLDDRLFLDKEFDTSWGVVFYSVKYHRGDQPPDLILDWRDDDDRPRDLTASIVTEIRRMMSEGPVSLERILAKNAAVTAQREAESRANYDALTREWEKYESPVRSGVLHRGQGLRIARDKQRARGRKV